MVGSNTTTKMMRGRRVKGGEDEEEKNSSQTRETCVRLSQEKLVIIKILKRFPLKKSRGSGLTRSRFNHKHVDSLHEGIKCTL